VDRLEVAKGDRLAFLTEGNLSVVADITPSFSFRAGYDVLFINTVALAANNCGANTSSRNWQRNIQLQLTLLTAYHPCQESLTNPRLVSRKIPTHSIRG
ncbi:MAG: hypothetical protein ACXW6T_25285, partial [Candidatus Binatia bacterium]